MTPADPNLQYKHNKLQTTLCGVGIAAALALAGILMLGLGERIPAEDHPRWRSFVISAGGVIAATGLLSVGWELLGRRALSREVLAVTGLAFQVQKAGLRNINTAYGEVLDWNKTIEGAGDIDLAVAWANTWRESHIAAWEAWANKGRGSARVLLPDVESTDVLAEVARKFGMDEQKVLDNVRDAAKGFADIGSVVQVRYTDVPLVWSYYGFPNDVVVTMHTIGKKKTHNVPALLLDPAGSVGSFFVTQFDSAWAAGSESSATPAPPSS